PGHGLSDLCFLEHYLLGHLPRWIDDDAQVGGVGLRGLLGGPSTGFSEAGALGSGNPPPGRRHFHCRPFLLSKDEINAPWKPFLAPALFPGVDPSLRPVFSLGRT